MRPHLRTALAAGVVLASLVATATITAGSAAAAGASLKVTTIDRAGAAVSGSEVQIVNLGTQKAMSGLQHSGGTVPLAAGQYAVITDIREPNGTADTIGAAVVKVSGATSVTIDARKGVQLKVSLDATGLGEQRLLDAICVGGVAANPASDFEGGTDGGTSYVVPNSSSSLRFGYLAEWGGGAEDTYAVTGGQVGVPTAPGGLFHSKLMATEHVQSNTGPNGGAEQDLSFVPQGSPCQARLQLDSVSNSGSDFPYGATAHLVAGKWDIRSDEFSQLGSNGTFHGVHDLAASQTYSQTFYRAGWGPARVLPYVYERQVRFDVNNMFQDPYTTGYEYGSKVSVKLSQGSKVIAQDTLIGDSWDGSPNDFTAYANSAAWYTLDAYAIRYRPGVVYPSGMLSPSTRAVFHFYADPRTQQVAQGVLSRFLVGGLDSRSRAKPKSITPVTLFMDRADPHVGVPYKADSAKTVQAWYSTDNGKNWHGLHVNHIGSTWSTDVQNPAEAKVSLSAKVTDAAGNSIQTYSNQAYAVR